MIATEVVPKCMTMAEIREKAKAVDVCPGKMKKAELVRSIQIAEGSTPCFGRSDAQCTYADCCFMQDCLKISLTESKRAEGHFRQEASKLTEAIEHLQEEVSQHKSAENELKQRRDQLERRVREQTVELAATNEKLQHEVTERQRAQNELHEYHDQFERHLREQSEQLTAVKEQLQREIARRQQAQERLITLQTKLDNANFIIQKHLELDGTGSEVPMPSGYGLMWVARLCGRVFGLLARALRGENMRFSLT